MSDKTVVVGGGIIGLSVAFELSSRGAGVTVIDKHRFAAAASWAGAGMLPPANRETAVHPLEHLEALSNDLHSQWADRLTGLTGVDTGYHQCGGLYVARTAGEVASLVGAMHEWDAREIQYEKLRPDKSMGRYLIEPFDRLGPVQLAVRAPSAAQFHNPNHNRALIAACQKNGVTLMDEVSEISIVASDGKICSVQTPSESISGDHFVFAAGAWTEKLLGEISVSLPMQPVRGQMSLYRISVRDMKNWQSSPILNEGSRYLVPRADGHVLAGATVEEAGFDCRTTDEEIMDLRLWAESIASDLNSDSYVRSWAGLRPGTFDGLPYLGRLNAFQNAIVATGHFKSGLQLSTGTAQVIADLIQDKPLSIDLLPFLPSRVHV